jgi:nitrilase
MWASSVDVHGSLVDRRAKAGAERGVHLAIGVNEREDDRPGSLYNALLVIGPEGVLHRHRK